VDKILEKALANYRTAPEESEEQAVNHSKRTGNYRTTQAQQARDELDVSKHNYRT